MKTLLSAACKLYPAILGLIGAAIIVIATSRYNAGVSTDSVQYIITARNIASGHGITYDGIKPYITGAPLYPMVLAAIAYVFKTDPLLVARFINAISFGLIVYLAGLWFKKHLKSSPAFAFLGTMSVLFSYVLVEVSLQVVSETLFICFMMLYLIFTEIYIEKRNLTSLIVLALTISLATLTRKIGFSLVVTGIITVLFLNRDTLSVRIRHCLLLISLLVLPLSAIFLRNYLASSLLFGNVYLPTGGIPFYTMMVNTYRIALSMLDTVIFWFVPELESGLHFLLISLSLAVGFITGIGYKEYQKKPHPNTLMVVFIIIFVAVYMGTILIIMANANKYIPRYLIPMFIPISLLLFILVEMILKPFLGRLFPKYGNLLFLAILAVWLIYPIRATILIVSSQIEKGYVYTGAAWKNSETIQFVSQHPELESECGRIYTNSYEAIYFFVGLKTSYSPSDESRGGVADISLLKGKWPQEDKSCLIWFDNITWRNYMFTPEKLLSIVNLEKAIHFQDGAIYFVTK